MVPPPCEEEEVQLECVICFCVYSRSKRIPRILHCSHTFCSVCLEMMSRVKDGVRTVACPLCRWITCTRATLSLPGVLFINTDIWDKISKEQQQDQQETVKSQTQNMKPSLFKSTLHKIFSCVYQNHIC